MILDPDLLASMQSESGGLWRVEFWKTDRLFKYLRSDRCDYAEAVMGGLVRMARACRDHPKHERPQCLTCERTFALDWGPSWAITVSPEVDEPSGLMLLFVCRVCSNGGREELRARTMGALRQHVMREDAREIAINNAVGHA